MLKITRLRWPLSQRQKNDAGITLFIYLLMKALSLPYMWNIYSAFALLFAHISYCWFQSAPIWACVALNFSFYFYSTRLWIISVSVSLFILCTPVYPFVYQPVCAYICLIYRHVFRRVPSLFCLCQYWRLIFVYQSINPFLFSLLCNT